MVRRVALLVVALSAAGAVFASTAAAAGVRPLRTAVFDPAIGGADAPLEYRRIEAAGASLVRIAVSWASVAPKAPDAASDPSDPAYTWDGVDAQLQDATDAGLTPFLDVVNAPSWAEPGKPAGTAVWHPDPQQLALFARAIATRYSGSFQGLPRVRYWQLWNEPNLNTNLQPQLKGLTPVSPGIYRGMLNAFARAVKAVDPANVVVVGGLAPYGIQKNGRPINKVLSVAPLTFMRDLLCVSAGAHPRATCAAKVEFDAFSVHPYTWGGPTDSAYSPNDVAIGDIPHVKTVLASAWRLHRITARALPQLWVTEFSWDTNPPDPKALPIAIQARWTAEALYHMWRDGVWVVTWFLLRDQARPSPFQSGLYFRGATVATDRPKPTLTAFRFPFVAYPRKQGTFVWGRVPDSSAHAVSIERKVGSRWRRIALLHANRAGVFEKLLPLSARTGYLRARVVGAAGRSLPFGLKAVPDRRISPFGS